jgi:predicted AAA+ superfamily ATPase
VDEDRRPGRFLLTGSANLMALPTVADSLAGRMETLSLLPLSQSEIESRSANWLDRAFAGQILKVDQPALGRELIERVLRGGYPEALSRATSKRRVTWARQYIDAGLLASLLDLTAEEVQQNRTRFGNALETFVYGELLKHTTTAHGDYHLMYYRDADKVEVDVVIENAVGNLVGVEVKAAATVTERDLRGLRKLANLAGEQFKMGVLLYDGTETMPLGDGIWAAPLSTLWGT